MQAGRGMWHDGGLDKGGRTRGFQLWIALPPELELGPTISIYQAPEDVPEDGPARVLLGSYGPASSAIASPSPINYLAVRLKAGKRWRYEPPTGHTVLWVAIASGVLSAPDELRHGDLAAFEPSSKAAEFEALTDTEFVLGSAALGLRGRQSIHISRQNQSIGFLQFTSFHCQPNISNNVRNVVKLGGVASMGVNSRLDHLRRDFNFLRALLWAERARA
jgi:hypothetical protein